MQSSEELKNIASQVRRDIIRMVTQAKSGHPGGSMSSADFLTALYFNVMDQNPSKWTRDGKDQDMFFLSAGHLTPVYYSILARAGYFPVSELATFRKFGTRLQGHPSIQKGLPGVVQASGSLGQGLSAAIGAALSKKLDKDPRTVFVMCGDGESEEGQIWEAAMFAPHHKVDNLIAMTDWNHKQIDGDTEDVAGLGDLEAKWKAFGWDVIVAEGNDMDKVLAAFADAKSRLGKGKPVMMLFKTEMGHGVDFMAGTHKWHGAAPSEEQCAEAMKQLKETLGDF
ncbi:MAG: transketolase [Candidatus Cryptobacteroides sp.]|jgi:transketolase|nr:transketolase [Bacteroidales bacterium]MCI2134459.1 transketolase [Bacteroidales bacterium]MEE3391028.1 transketolase [Candidatus Cryptobacteroides sp.]MEE3430585.1 transketolase [Candidatus Cryptobacteroides sp.]